MTEPSARPAGDARARSWRTRGAIALVILGAVAVRLIPVRYVFSGDPIHVLGDGDAVYHVWRAQQIAKTWPRPNWFDPLMDYPYGASIPWPPFFDGIAATAAVLTGGASPDHVARVAAIVPVVLAAILVPVVAALGATLVPGTGITAALVAALLPASVHFSYVGLTDHHIADLLLFTAAALAFVRSWSAGRLRLGPALSLGLVLALSFWNWHGSALTLLVLAGCVATSHLVEPAGRTAAAAVEWGLGAGSAVAALLLLASIAMFGPPGALERFELSGVNGLAPVLAAAVAIGCGALLALRRFRSSASRPPRRAVEVAVAGLAAAALPMAIPGARAGIVHGITEARAGNSFYATIAELQPTFFSGRASLLGELQGVGAFTGLAVLLLPIAVVALVCAWRAYPERRQRTLFLATFGPLVIALWISRLRFILYASVALGLWCAVALHHVTTWLSARTGSGREDLVRRLVLAAGWALVVVPGYALGGITPEPATDAVAARMVQALTRARERFPGGEHVAVLAPWPFGHALRVAGHPVVVNPFGSDIGRRGLEDEARFFFSDSEQDAERVLTERRVRFVVVTAPLVTADALRGFVPTGDPPVVEIESGPGGRTVVPLESFKRTALARLFFGDGMSPRATGGPSWGGLRLIREELPTPPSGVPDAGQIKTFEFVRGATLRVLGATGRVEAEAHVTTSAGRTFRWRTYADPSPDGVAEIRVPYATGRNGDVDVGRWMVRAGPRAGTVAVEPGAPERGAIVHVDLRR